MKCNLAAIVLIFVWLLPNEGSGETAMECHKHHMCHEFATCVMLNSTSDEHTCRCDNGFQGDGLVCEDINECKLDGQCPPDTRCFNLDGGYTCVHVSMNASPQSAPVGCSVALALGFTLSILLTH